MKTWIFATLQAAIALLGLAAFFLAENFLLAALAAVLAAALGIAQPLLSAHKSRQLDAYRNRQYQQSVATVDDHLQAQLEGVIEPPDPHRATVQIVLRNRIGDRSTVVLNTYDRLIEAMAEGSKAAMSLAEQFQSHVPSSSVATYLRGLAALNCGNAEQAHQQFTKATEQQSSWILPWLGWATTAYRLGLWHELRTKHPHLCGVELLPYGAGDEQTFIELSEAERTKLTDQFQLAATSLGTLYTVAELTLSRQQITDTQAELAKVA